MNYNAFNINYDVFNINNDAFNIIFDGFNIIFNAFNINIDTFNIIFDGFSVINNAFSVKFEAQNFYEFENSNKGNSHKSIIFENNLIVLESKRNNLLNEIFSNLLTDEIGSTYF